MTHYHKTANGQKTGIEVIVDKQSSLHYHITEIDGEVTTTDLFKVGHTHLIDGIETSEPININDDGEKNMSIESFEVELKEFSGRVIEVKQEERNGEPVGVIYGHIATWDIDRGRDQFIRGAFTDSIQEHMSARRQIRLKDHHGRTIGGFPIESVREDEKGLYARGEINLNVQQGKEAYALAKQGVLTDFSIGFSSLDDNTEDGVRKIKRAIIWEGSIVDEPMNTRANILEIKSVVPFQDLPVAPRDAKWDKRTAIKNVRSLTNSTDNPTARYKRAFLWFDREDSENFGSYKLPIADVIDGRLTAIPRAIFAAASAMRGARGGVDLPENDRRGVIRNLERYYAKMDMDSPFSEKQYFDVADVKEMTPKDLEKVLRQTSTFSKEASTLIASGHNKRSENKGLYTLEEAEVLINIKNFSKTLKK